MAGETKAFRAQNLILEDRKRLSVSGVEEVEGFDESFVQMQTVLGVLLIRGENLHMENLSVETGDLLISGQISEITYENNPSRSGFFSRLFG